MPLTPGFQRLETDRLILRRQDVADAPVFRQLWTERDARVPLHRRINAEGRPSVDDIVLRIRTAPAEPEPGILAVERKGTGEVIGYCGLIPGGKGTAGEPELAYEFLRAVHGLGYATEAAEAVVSLAAGAGHARLWASVWAWNVASRRVLQKLGFHEMGPFRADILGNANVLTARDLWTTRAAHNSCS